MPAPPSPEGSEAHSVGHHSGGEVTAQGDNELVTVKESDGLIPMDVFGKLLAESTMNDFQKNVALKSFLKLKLAKVEGLRAAG